MPPITPLNAAVQSWKEMPTRDPYTGADPPRPIVQQRIKASVRAGGEVIPVDVFYAPHTEDWDYWKYVVRAKTDAGRKSKDVFDSPDGLYIKDRGTPWTSEKAWTYLSKEACERRAQIAGLDEIIADPDPESESKHAVLLGKSERALVDDQGQLADELVETLTKGVLVFKSESNPAT